MDIHPAAVIGPGLLIDHGTGVVIGETAVVGANCSFLHNVTLGSSGKERGDRHPKLGDDILLGCNVTILGNISVGNSCKVGSGSVVLKSLPAGVTAVGIPARVVGRSNEVNSGKSMDHGLQNVISGKGKQFLSTLTLWADASSIFEEVDEKGTGLIDFKTVMKAAQIKYSTSIPPPEGVLLHIFSELDANHDGLVNKREFECILEQLGAFDGTVDWNKTVVAEWADYVQGLSLEGSSL